LAVPSDVENKRENSAIKASRLRFPGHNLAREISSAASVNNCCKKGSPPVPLSPGENRPTISGAKAKLNVPADISTLIWVRLRKSRPKMTGNGPSLSILNSWSQVNDNKPTCNFAAFETSPFLPSPRIQVTEKGVKIQGSPHRHKYSTTSERIQENWAPVSIKAGSSPKFSFSLTHNKIVECTAAAFRNAANVAAARAPNDRRAPARFPTKNYFGGSGV
jgi:hypothetical protein